MFPVICLRLAVALSTVLQWTWTIALGRNLTQFLLVLWPWLQRQVLSILIENLNSKSTHNLIQLATYLPFTHNEHGWVSCLKISTGFRRKRVVSFQSMYTNTSARLVPNYELYNSCQQKAWNMITNSCNLQKTKLRKVCHAEIVKCGRCDQRNPNKFFPCTFQLVWMFRFSVCVCVLVFFFFIFYFSINGQSSFVASSGKFKQRDPSVCQIPNRESSMWMDDN